ncbi:MAG: glycoside hydrolase family 3 C-terminal domain-containing protein [Myxococcales bacterium]|nr:glycoside hydrolase family 3 C-terminal domain-containing protein [Myxococcales bacterium]
MRRSHPTLPVSAAAALACGLIWLPTAAHAKPPAPLYQDPGQPTEARVASLLSEMTLDEKLVLISGKGFESRAVPRLQIPELTMTDGPNGVRWGKTATAFPVGISLASAFDPELVERMGKVLAAEARARGRAVLLAPCVNISRVPQNGRNFECFGEDPVLSARTAVSYIKGVQDGGAIATVKHFACNNQEHRRREIDVRVSKRALHEIYFPAFEAAVKEAGVYTVMAAYNKVNGLYSTENPYLLEDILKKRWGFKGFVMSDWDAVQHTLEPVMAGLDLEMPEGTYTGEDKLKPVVTSGKVTSAVIDEKVKRILWVMFKSGVFDAPPKEQPGVVGSEAHRAVALDVARASIALLKNDRNALPLVSNPKLKSVAVIGPGAVYPRVGGGGSGEVRPDTAVRPLEALTTMLRGHGVTVDYEPGFNMDGDVETVPPAAFSHKEGDQLLPGLVAEFFNNKNVEGAAVKKSVVKQIDFDWGNDPPAEGVNSDFFSVRYTGFITPKTPGRYRMLGVANNGFRVFIDGKPLLNAWDGEEFKKPTAELDLEARPYEIRMDFFDNKAQAKVRLGWGRVEGSQKEAVVLARRSDAAIIFAGFSDFFETESSDHGLELPKNQVDLIKAVANANPRTIVVLNNGSPLLMEDWVGRVPALVEAWYPGQEGGTAIAEILTGWTNPSGRLPFTFLKAWKHAPAFKTYPEVGDTAPYDEGIFVGYRHYDAKNLPVRFPFGHGLSYTRFVYADLQIQPAPGEQGGPAWEVSFAVTNKGTKRGAEVAQVYLGQAKSPVPRPPRALRAFQKLTLEPKESRRVSLRLSSRDLAYFDEAKDDWVVPAGVYQIQVGASSRDIRLKGTFTQPALTASDCR